MVFLRGSREFPRPIKANDTLNKVLRTQSGDDTDALSCISQFPEPECALDRRSLSFLLSSLRALTTLVVDEKNRPWIESSRSFHFLG